MLILNLFYTFRNNKVTIQILKLLVWFLDGIVVFILAQTLKQKGKNVFESLFKWRQKCIRHNNHSNYVK